MSVALQTTKKFAAFSVPGTTTSKDVPAAAGGSKTAQSSKNNKAAVNSSSKQQATPAAVSVSTSSASVSAPTVDIEALILSTLASTNEIADTWQFAQQHSLDHQEVVGAIKSLLVDAYVADSPLSATIWSVSEEGAGVLQYGSPEIQVLRAVIAAGSLSIASLNSQLGEVAKIGMGVCMKNKWIAKNGENVDALVQDVQDETANVLQQVQSTSGQGLNTNDLNNLKKRKLVQQVTRKSYRITKGVDFREKRVRKVADLTKAMLGKKEEMEEGAHWSDLSFKSVNLNAMGAPVAGGNFHPLMKVRAEFRRILMDMGFQEMPTNRWVESSFWNFDSLFQPQSHPARDAHDTFFIKSPAQALTVPEDYYELVKATHENGGFGSIGYGCVFQREEAFKNLLRTHTTAISAQMLYRMAQDMKETGVFTPKKYFSIDRVFRNEAMDATHLCEFHQVEGLVADRNLTLGNLIGVIKTFFEKIGITQLRFKPAYNPYTEPSMEIFGYHPELKKWTEIGNSGMFRPEMLRPMGLPEDVRVIAWGLSLERPTMIKYRIENIRDLFGHKADLNKQRNAPIARF
jgi:phenylalanyl-tRNA synthetase alpha chain